MQQRLWGETAVYVDNDVDVDDVDDDDEGAGAYFLVRHSNDHTNCELYIEWSINQSINQ